MRNKEMCARFDMVNGPVGSLESDLITQVGINGQSNSKERLPMYSQVNISHVLRHFPLNQHIKRPCIYGGILCNIFFSNAYLLVITMDSFVIVCPDCYPFNSHFKE